MQFIANHLPTAARLLLGFVFFVFGLNGFLGFMPQPSMPAEAGQFMGALAESGYFFPVLKALETLSGLALLTGAFVPLALTVLAPIVSQIALFHVFLAPGGLPIALFLLAAELYLAWAYRDAFRGVLQARAQPSTPASRDAAAPGWNRKHSAAA